MTSAPARTLPGQAELACHPVLESKITVPALPRWVISRPRLTKRIAAGAATPLTVVTGPPGAGKTTALASWAAVGTAPGRVAWVTLDDYDNRPGSFWSYVAAALDHAGVAVPGGVPAPAHGGAVDRGFLLRLASVLAARPLPVVLVLDDLHVITAPGPLRELADLLRYAQPGLRLIAAARADPPLPLHRYRVSGDLTEVSAAELSFTVPEAARLMTQHAITLPAATLELITKRVEGWAAGLRLTALSLDNHPDPALVIKNLTAEDNPITGYLVAEVLDAQPPAVRDLMLRTSVLDQVSAGLAGELAGDEQAAEILATLARSNAFVEPLGGGWYRFHSLLTAVLRVMLRRESPGCEPRLHQRAARWYLRNGLDSQAIAHIEQIGDWALTAEIVIDELAAGDLAEPGASSPLADRLRQLPRPPGLPGAQAQPQSLLAAAALQLSDGRDRSCASQLDTAERLLGQLPAHQENTARLAAAQIRFAAARRAGDLDGARSAVVRLHAAFDQLPSDLRTRHPRIRAHILSARGIVDLWSGNLAGAATAFRDGAAAAPEGSREQAACRGHLALIEALHGHLNRAAELAAAATMPPARHCIPSAAVALALVHLQRYEPVALHRRLSQASAALRARPDRLTSALACLTAARAALAQSRGAAAADLLRRARHDWSPPPWLDHMLTVTQSQVHAAAGDIQAALDAAARAGSGSALDARVATARAWLAEGDLEAARQAMVGRADDAADLGILLQACVTDALIGYRGGHPAEGRCSLERALRLGEPEGYRLPYVWDWAWFRSVLRRDPELANAFSWLVPAGQAPGGGNPARAAGTAAPAPVITGQLSDREREVLRHASSLLSTEEIAREMYISANTVKTHLKNIYRKLGAAGRGDAVRRARQQKLI